MQILLSSSSEKFIKTPRPRPYLPPLMACCMHNAWERYKITEFVMRIHLRYKSPRSHIHFNFKVHTPAQSHLIKHIKLKHESVTVRPWRPPRGDMGFPSHHFIPAIDLMWTWTICPALIAHVLLRSLIGGLHYRGICNSSRTACDSPDRGRVIGSFTAKWSWSPVKQKIWNSMTNPNSIHIQ